MCIFQVHLCPPGVLPELWQSWLVHWETWKDIYISLSWVHKYRKVCTPEYVEWHDSYLEDYPWIIPCITDELGTSDFELDGEYKNDTNQKNSQENHDIDEDIHLNIHHDSPVSLNQDVGEKQIPLNGSQNDTEKSNDLDIPLLTESISRKHNVQKDSSDQSLAYTDVRKEALDALYEKHSAKRYWVHLRSFLQNCGLEANDDIASFFAHEAGIEFSESKADNINEKNLEDRDDVILECNEGECFQDTAEGKDMKIEELSKETDEPAKIQSSPKQGSSVNAFSQDVLHTFDKITVPHQGTNGHEDDNDRNIKERCQKLVHKEDNDYDKEAHLKNACTLNNCELYEDEGRIVCDSLKALVAEQSDDHTKDASKNIVDSFKDFVLEQSDDSKLDGKVPLDYHYSNGIMSQVNLDIDGTEKEQIGRESCSHLTTSSDVKELLRKKKKKKSKDSR